MLYGVISKDLKCSNVETFSSSRGERRLLGKYKSPALYWLEEQRENTRQAGLQSVDHVYVSSVFQLISKQTQQSTISLRPKQTTPKDQYISASNKAFIYTWQDWGKGSFNSSLLPTGIVNFLDTTKPLMPLGLKFSISI